MPGTVRFRDVDGPAAQQRQARHVRCGSCLPCFGWLFRKAEPKRGRVVGKCRPDSGGAGFAEPLNVKFNAAQIKDPGGATSPKGVRLPVPPKPTQAIVISDSVPRPSPENPREDAPKSPGRREALREHTEGFDSKKCFKRQLTSGFCTKPEPETIQVASQNIAPFTLPEEAFTFEPDSKTIVTVFPNGDQERLIHCNTKLEAEEQKALKLLQKEAVKQGKVFLPSIAVAATRYINDARGDIHAALEKMEMTQEWRLDYFKGGPIIDESLIEDLKLGVIYFTGRDCMLRPTLVVRPARAPLALFNESGVEKLTRAIIFCMEYFLRYMVVPGKVENLNVILDLKGLAISQIPVNALLRIRKIMSLQYTGRVYRFYICNMSWMMQAVAGVVQAAMTDRQREKVVFVRGATELRREFALHHLEADLGGNRQEITSFFPFPLHAGPFSGGYKGGPRTDAVPGMHGVLSSNGVRGRLWDPKIAVQMNTRFEFSDSAGSILLGCRGLEALAADAAAANPQEPETPLPPNPQEPELPLGMDGVDAAQDGVSEVPESPSTLDSLPLIHSRQRNSDVADAMLDDTVIMPCGKFTCSAPIAFACWKS